MLLERLELYAMGITEPSRVLITGGYAISLRRAKRRAARYDAILVRKDGWTIGFPKHLRQEALALWPADWDALCDLTTGKVHRLNQEPADGC